MKNFLLSFIVITGFLCHKSFSQQPVFDPAKWTMLEFQMDQSEEHHNKEKDLETLFSIYQNKLSRTMRKLEEINNVFVKHLRKVGIHVENGLAAKEFYHNIKNIIKYNKQSVQIILNNPEVLAILLNFQQEMYFQTTKLATEFSSTVLVGNKFIQMSAYERLKLLQNLNNELNMLVGLSYRMHNKAEYIATVGLINALTNNVDWEDVDEKISNEIINDWQNVLKK